MKAFGLLPWVKLLTWWEIMVEHLQEVDTWICARMGREEGSR